MTGDPGRRIAEYRAFLGAKAQLATASGFDVDPAEVHPVLKPHQRDAVVWAVRGGRRAIFAAFGLGKTLMQLEAERLVLAKTGGRGLIVCPLGVRQEFIRDARLLGLEVRFIRTTAEAPAEGIYITNYESVRDGKLDPRAFDVISLDEAAILRGFGGTKTFRELMRMYEGSAAYRFVATATPSPNEFIELLSYAAFLDILDVGQGKTRFFKRDSTHADRLTLHPHMVDEFWLWVASWALFLQKPSDLGHDDSGVPEYVLVFRKPPTDNADGYADVPVAKSKSDYSRARWQTDAHGFWRSDGNRPLLPEELENLPAAQVFRRFRDHYLAGVYDYEQHVRIGEHLDRKGRLPSGFMLLQPPSAHPDVWTDVARMRTLNMLQERKGQQFHLCPLQFDIVDRLIARYSMEGETVFDPFAGLMTVPYCAVKAGRPAVGIELNPRYFADGAAYVQAAAAESMVPTLFDMEAS